MEAKRSWRVLEAATIVLFTAQAIRVLLAMLFAQVYDALFDGEGMLVLTAGGMLTLAMLLMPLLSPTRPKAVRGSLRWAALGCALARLPLSWDVPLLRLASALVVLACANLYITGLLQTRARMLLPAFCLGWFADQVLRAWGDTYDLGLRSWWWPIQLVLSAGLVLLAFILARREGEPQEPDRVGLGAGLAYGSALFMLSSLLALPNAAARWTGGGYPLMVMALLALATLPLWPGVATWLSAEGRLTRWETRLLLVLFLVGLAVADRGAAWGVTLRTAALLVAAAAFWLLLPRALRAGVHRPRAGMVLGLGLWLLFSAAHAFAFTYAYTLPQFQGAGLPTFLVAALLFSAIALRPRPASEELPAVLPGAHSRFWVIGLALLWLLAAVVALPPAPHMWATSDVARLGTYNIHYGFDSDWHLTLEEQARTIAASGADLVALQEVDTGRLTSFGVDDALWLARRLRMQVIYLPTVEHTTGIAMLSRLEIMRSASRLLPSQAEPTGIIRITVNVGGRPLHAHGTWLGLSPEERARQLEAALAFIGAGRATLAGDLNATPDSPVYAALQAQGFIDPFIAGRFPPAPTDPAIEPNKRIDYIWLRGLTPEAALVLDSLASDHRMVVVAAR